jgi:hypothetical protein
MKKLLLIAAAIILGGLAHDAKAGPVILSGSDLLESCTSKLELQQVYCDAYVQGVVDTLKVVGEGVYDAVVCVPANSGAEQTRDVVVLYLQAKQSNPSEKAAAVSVARALAEAWPCKARGP